MTLVLIPRQLTLFPLPDPPVWHPVNDFERDARSGDQWLRSITAYCTWRAGECWRKLYIRSQRESAERWQYLDAVRLMANVRYGPERLQPQLTLPALHRISRQSPYEQRLAVSGRAWLVDLLMKADPKYTDRRLLGRFSRAKLARLIVLAAKSESQMERKRAEVFKSSRGSGSRTRGETGGVASTLALPQKGERWRNRRFAASLAAS